MEMAWIPDHVTLVLTDRSTWEVTPTMARKLCSQPDLAGKIVDALTDNRKLQSELRRIIDNMDD